MVRGSKYVLGFSELMGLRVVRFVYVSLYSGTLFNGISRITVESLAYMISFHGPFQAFLRWETRSCTLAPDNRFKMSLSKIYCAEFDLVMVHEKRRQRKGYCTFITL